MPGCGDRARIDVVSLDFSNLDPQRPLVQRIEPDSCRWWTDDEETLWIVMTRRIALPLGPVKNFDFELSLRLDRLPSGKARQYSVDRDALRARVRFGLNDSRLSSTAGIAVVERIGPDRLQGTFRIQTARDVVQLLGGWAAGPRALLLSTFDARPDDGSGRAIVASTESNGFARSPRRRSDPPHPRPASPTRDNGSAPSSIGP